MSRRRGDVAASRQSRGRVAVLRWRRGGVAVFCGGVAAASRCCGGVAAESRCCGGVAAESRGGVAAVSLRLRLASETMTSPSPRRRGGVVAATSSPRWRRGRVVVVAASRRGRHRTAPRTKRAPQADKDKTAYKCAICLQTFLVSATSKQLFAHARRRADFSRRDATFETVASSRRVAATLRLIVRTSRGDAAARDLDIPSPELPQVGPHLCRR